MLPKEYIKAVDRLLYLPPRIRSQELRNLQQEIDTGLNLGHSIISVEKWMNEPDETACMISDKYPVYHQSPLAVVPMVMTYGGLWGFAHSISEWLTYSAVASMRLPDYLASTEYQLDQVAEKSVSLSPLERAALCLVLVVVGIFGTYYFKYTPES